MRPVFLLCYDGSRSQYMYLKSLYCWIQLAISSYKLICGEPHFSGFQNRMKVKTFWIIGCKGSLERNRAFLRLLKRRKRYAPSYRRDWDKHPGCKKPSFIFCVLLGGISPHLWLSCKVPWLPRPKGEAVPSFRKEFNIHKVRTGVSCCQITIQELIWNVRNLDSGVHSTNGQCILHRVQLMQNRQRKRQLSFAVCLLEKVTIQMQFPWISNSWGLFWRIEQC